MDNLCCPFLAKSPGQKPSLKVREIPTEPSRSFSDMSCPSFFYRGLKFNMCTNSFNPKHWSLNWKSTSTSWHVQFSLKSHAFATIIPFIWGCFNILQTTGQSLLGRNKTAGFKIYMKPGTLGLLFLVHGFALSTSFCLRHLSQLCRTYWCLKVK